MIKIFKLELKTYYEFVDEISYKERRRKRTSGQIGLCGAVRGVGAILI